MTVSSDVVSDRYGNAKQEKMTLLKNKIKKRPRLKSLANGPSSLGRKASLKVEADPISPRPAEADLGVL